MKNIFKYILAAAAISLAATACVEEETHPYGESDVDGCYGVYFPVQATDVILDPADPTTYTIKATRNVTKDRIVVPFTIKSETDVFSFSELSFDDGQSESEITIDFSKSEVGVTYSCTLSIDDPQYASKYGTGAVAIDFSVCREKWNELGKVNVSEYYYWEIEIPSDHEKAAIIYQNDLDKNLFRLENPFAKRYTNFTDGDTWFTFRVLKPGEVLYKGQAGYETKITMSDLVYFNAFNTGFTHSNYGAKILMCHPSGFDSYKGNQDAWSFSCVSQYQEDGTPGVVEIGCLYNMDGIGGWDGSQELCMKIVFPGFVETDYSIEMEAGLTYEGEVPVYFYTGVDAKKIRFKAFEGRLNTAEKNKYVESVAAGTEEGTTEIAAVPDDPATENYIECAVANLSFAKTGVYTLVGVTVDAEGNGQEGDVIEFTYVAPEDEEENAVVLSCGVELTRAYESLGMDKTNSAQIYLTGEGVTKLYYQMFPTATVEKNGLELCVATMLANGTPISDDELAEVNSSVFVKMVTNLNPKTAYTLVVYATNGYCEKVLTSEIETDGLPLVSLGQAVWSTKMWNIPDEYLANVDHDPNIKSEYRVYFDDLWFYSVIDKEKKTAVVPLQRLTAYDATSSIYIIEQRSYYTPETEGYDTLPISSYNETKDIIKLEVVYCVINDSTGDLIGSFGKFEEVFSKPAAASSASISLSAFNSIDFTNAKLEQQQPSKEMAEQIKKLCSKSIESEYQPKSAGMTLESTGNATKSSKKVSEKKIDTNIHRF